jgi:UDP-N-acetylmuramyl pentapeptide synthase
MVELQSSGIFPLSIFAVESLVYCRESISVVAEHQAATFGQRASDLIQDAYNAALQAVSNDKTISYLASRIAERQMRDQLMSAIPSREKMVKATDTGELNLNLTSPYPAEHSRLITMVKERDIDAIVARYPVRESTMLDAVSKALHFPNRQLYEKALLARLSEQEDLRASLKTRLGNLSEALA